jgi:hypothetical protein
MLGREVIKVVGSINFEVPLAMNCAFKAETFRDVIFVEAR